MSTAWLTPHPEIQVLDCTIRDGGLVNDHLFGDRFVRAVYDCCVAAHIDCMEIGYKNSDEKFSPAKNGPWKFCHEEDLRRVVGDNKTPLKLSCMADAGKSNWKKDILPKKDSVLDVIRVAFYHYQLEEALDMIRDAKEKGYEVWGNMMAVTDTEEKDIDRCLAGLAESPADTIAIVDSYGTLLPEWTAYLTKKYVAAVGPAGKTVGIHAHNNQQLAFANTIEAVRNGAMTVDASIGGLGRGAGNCPMELLLGFLKNPKHDIRPVFECLEKHYHILKNQIEWGPFPEFMITGQANKHPRAAIAAREGIQRGNYTEFYDSIFGDQTNG